MTSNHTQHDDDVPVTATQLDDIDVLILDQEALDEFVTNVGGWDNIPTDTTVLTDDEFTRGKVEFNLIDAANGTYGIVTQLSDPFVNDDWVIDARKRSETDFSDWLLGLE